MVKEKFNTRTNISVWHPGGFDMNELQYFPHRPCIVIHRGRRVKSVSLEEMNTEASCRSCTYYIFEAFFKANRFELVMFFLLILDLKLSSKMEWLSVHQAFICYQICYVRSRFKILRSAVI